MFCLSVLSVDYINVEFGSRRRKEAFDEEMLEKRKELKRSWIAKKSKEDKKRQGRIAAHPCDRVGVRDRVA